MTTNYALNFINEALKFNAKSDIVSKYAVSDDQIKNNYEVYDEQGRLKFRHAFSAVTREIILSNLYSSMLGLCISQTPIKLLVTKGQGSDIVRNLNDDFDIRKPAYPVVGEELDIDEALALVAVYQTLYALGISSFSSKEKELLGEYEDSVRLPNPKFTADLAFRFSPDGISWHSEYQDGDKYFGIYKNGAWSRAIPLIGGGGGAKSFLALNDTPSAYEADKFLKSDGKKLIFADIPAAPEPAPLSIKTLAYAGGLSLGEDTLIFTEIKENTEFTLKSIVEGRKYDIILKTGGHTLSFASSITPLCRISDIKPLDAYVKFGLIKTDGKTFALDLSLAE